MRILHIDTGREMRGGQWQVLYLMESLRARGHESVLLARPSAPLFDAARLKGLDVRPAGLAAVMGLSARMDVVHAHDARAHSMAAFLSRAPLVVSRRVAFPVQRSFASRWKYSRPWHFIAVSEFVKSRLIDAGVPAERISVVYDGVPLGRPGKRGNRIVAPAIDDPRKGADLLRRAAAVGGFEVDFSTSLKEDLSRGAAVFVYITHEEGLGSAVLLAMAAGIPVVASRVGGLPEAVAHEETGLLVENTPQAVAAAIRRLLDDREAASEMGTAGRRRAEALFGVEAMAGATLQVYHRLLPC
jgi:glycosyltransferase involved in cell wall biosynthesis